MYTIAVAQLTANEDLERNYRVCEKFVRQAKTANAAMIFFPENFDFISTGPEYSLKMARPISDPYINRFQILAQENDLWISLGGFHEINSDSGKMYNTHLILDNKGNIAGTYRKWHLFDINIPNGPKFKESALTDSGKDKGQAVVKSPIGNLGLSICYDLRFPEFYRNMTLFQDVHILVIPATWTFHTGPHWEPLLKARAIENQCYVIASAQVGQHNEKRRSAGQSMVVDPWGNVIAKSSDIEGVFFATISHDYLNEVRLNMPVLSHANKSLFTNKTTENSEN